MSDKTIVVFVGRRVPKCLTEISASHFGGGKWMFRCEVNDADGFANWRAKTGKSFVVHDVQPKDPRA